jgi:hypothetical protein
VYPGTDYVTTDGLLPGSVFFLIGGYKLDSMLAIIL